MTQNTSMNIFSKNYEKKIWKILVRFELLFSIGVFNAQKDFLTLNQ